MQPRFSQLAAIVSALVLAAGLMACGSEGYDVGSTSIPGTTGGAIDDEGYGGDTSGGGAIDDEGDGGDGGGAIDDEGDGGDADEICSPIEGLRGYGFWRNHEEDWPIDPNTELCGQTWLEIMNTPPRNGDVWYILAHQWIAAELAFATVGVAAAGIEEAFDDAWDLIEPCEIDDGNDRKAALEHAKNFEAYTQGELLICE